CVETTQRNPGLVAHDDHRDADLREATKRCRSAGHEAHLRGIGIERNVLEQRSVLVEEDGWAQQGQGHDDSRMGNTIISGTTVSEGCVRTKRIASATLRGSCSRLVSMS